MASRLEFEPFLAQFPAVYRATFMQTSEEKPVLKCDTIVLSSRGLAETHGKKIVIFVPANEIDRITLKFGRSDHRPILTISIGIILGLVGVFGLVEFFIAMRGYRYELGMVAFGIIGASLIFDTLKERYFLEIETKKGIQRLVFSKNAQKKEIEEFCAQAGAIYNYQIADSVKPGSGSRL
ncbi:MAG TPA: hypothetical protein VMF08_21805 [Candidatus Sulfotelmatobacter sp.]|nr:hypothetical protein [Candidatus Sulfotelmatobacter sp.]